jgi:hypothetical protein
VGVGWPELGTFSGPGRACMSGLEGDGGDEGAPPPYASPPILKGVFHLIRSCTRQRRAALCWFVGCLYKVQTVATLPEDTG